MYKHQHNQNSHIDLNGFVPGLPVYEDIAEGLAGRLIDFISRMIDYVSRLSR